MCSFNLLCSLFNCISVESINDYKARCEVQYISISSLAKLIIFKCSFLLCHVFCIID